MRAAPRRHSRQSAQGALVLVLALVIVACFMSAPSFSTASRLWPWTWRAPARCAGADASFSLSPSSAARLAAADRLPAPPPPFASLARRSNVSVAAQPTDVVYVTAFPRNTVSSLRSLCFFSHAGTLGTVHLIVPDRMADFFSSAAVLDALQCPRTSAWPGAAAPRLAFSVWPESQIVPRFGPGAPFGGTTRQMTLKLAAAKVVTTPFYLVMDSDVYVRRPFSRADLYDSATGLRARTNVDQTDFCQPAPWFNHASRVLASPIVADTDSFCARVAAAAGFPSSVGNCPPEGPPRAPQWFFETGNATVPDNPFSLRSGIVDGGGSREVYGACRSARGHSSHVTPMILSRDIVLEVLAPRLEVLEAMAAPVKATSVRPKAQRDWLDVLLDYHLNFQACVPPNTARFYTWTEYTLYFVAAVSSSTMGQYHSFAEGGITSIHHSMMKPWNYDSANWSRIFSADGDPPFFIVHSWFGKAIDETDGHMSYFVPTLAASAMATFPAPPSPLPFW